MSVWDVMLGLGLCAGWLTAVYFLLSAAQLAHRCERSFRWLRGGESARTAPSRSPQLVLIWPMLREDALVSRALGQLLDEVRARASVEVVVISTAREEVQRDEARNRLETGLIVGSASDDLRPLAQLALNRSAVEKFLSLAWGSPADRVAAAELLRASPRPLTVEVARTVAGELNSKCGRNAFFVVEAPATAAGKVGQMNAGLAWWKEHRFLADGRDTYVGVYDADSQPDARVFQVIDQVVGEREAAGGRAPAVLQQVSCYCQNLNTLPGLAGALSIADGLAQTRWALGFELPLYADYSAAVRAGRLRRLVYCVGHGCFVLLAWLDRIGGFPMQSPNDDLALGYLASLSAEEVYPLRALDYCDVAPDPLATIRQSRFWFLGSARFQTDLAIYRQAFGFRPGLLQMLVLLVDGRLRNFCWAWRPAFWLAAVLFAVFTQAWLLLGVLLAAHLLYVQVGLVHTLTVLRRLPGAAHRVGLPSLSWPRLFLVAVVASVTFFLRGIGPMLGSIGLMPRKPIKIER
ncbi:MAG TPA: hypothetical protein VHR66_18400 [Gemmataceae bacterium]|jgi:hypothetical protein|nr:hypothetical protein [Gemmataceae bacterium]